MKHWKRIGSLITAALLLFSLTVFGEDASERTLTGADAVYTEGLSASATGITGINAGDYVGFSGVDLTGIQSIRVLGKAEYMTSRNCEIFQIRIDGAETDGRLIGLLRFDENGEHTFAANIDAVSGVHDLYFKAQFSVGGNEIYRITLSTEPVDDVYIPVPENVIIDNYHDTWVATDGMGRAVADFSEAGDVKGDRYVGMFFWNWHGNFDTKSVAYIPSEIVAAYPEAHGDYNHPAWDPNGVFFWNEPIFGYYVSTDYWVYRKQAVLLANADVDVVFFDHTNSDAAGFDALQVQLEAWRDARSSGVNAPKISSITSWKSNRVRALKFLYEAIFQNGSYSDLWFYWDGKPMMITKQSLANQYEFPEDPVDRALTDEAFQFFTLREMGSRTLGPTGPNQLMWLDDYPQYAYSIQDDGRPEFMSLGLAVNESYVWGIGVTGVFSDEYTKGRSYSEGFGEDYSENSFRKNYFFREQMSRVLDADPHFVFVDGWNEWIAGRQRLYSNVENAFVDTYDNEGSRDIEPTRGPLKDDTYCLFVDFVRKYKGVRPAPVASGEKTIDINGALTQWDDVLPEFINDFDDYERDSTGRRSKETKEQIRYQTTVNNSISRAKVARDADNFYFYVKTTRDIQPGTDHWMNLFINVDRNYATGWEGYDFAVNLEGAGVLSSNVGAAWQWQKLGTVNYTVSGNVLTLAIPRVQLGKTNDAELEFKWTDSVDPAGDIVEFYNGGSVAPMGRFNYLYTQKQQTSLSLRQKSSLYQTAILAAGKNTMIVSGNKMKVYDADTRITPEVLNGVLYLPAEALNDILGYGTTKVEWDAEDQRLFVSLHDLEDRKIVNSQWIHSVVGSCEVRINGYLSSLTNSVQLINGLPYVPVTYVADCLGWKVYDAGGNVWAIGRDAIDTQTVTDVLPHLQ